MRVFEPRVYNICELAEWHDEGKLVLNQGFQKRTAWADDAKKYLIDTIIKGKPIPKILIRRKIHSLKKTVIKDVVDGQQRLRTIFSFLKDGFSIPSSSNAESSAKFFSDLPDSVKDQILKFEISVDELVNLPDSEVLDIIRRQTCAFNY